MQPCQESTSLPSCWQQKSASRCMTSMKIINSAHLVGIRQVLKVKWEDCITSHTKARANIADMWLKARIHRGLCKLSSWTWNSALEITAQMLRYDLGQLVVSFHSTETRWISRKGTNFWKKKRLSWMTQRWKSSSLPLKPRPLWTSHAHRASESKPKFLLPPVTSTQTNY